MAADPTTNDSFTVEWFVNDNLEFQTYNQVMAGMVEHKVVGDKATTNFLTSRWISTMIAVEATCQSAFLFLQAAFQAIARTLTQVLQLEFSSAFETLKDNGVVALLALKVTLSMVPLLVLGLISPSAAYEKVAGALHNKIEDQKKAEVKAKNDLDAIRKEVAKVLNLKATAVAKMDAAALGKAITAAIAKEKTAAQALLNDIGTALAIADFNPAAPNALTQVLQGIETIQELNTGYFNRLQEVDAAILEARGAGAVLITATNRVALIQQLVTDKTAQLEELRVQLGQATTAMEGAKISLADLQASTDATIGQLRAQIEGLTRDLATARATPADGGGALLVAQDAGQAARIRQLEQDVARLEKAVTERETRIREASLAADQHKTQLAEEVKRVVSLQAAIKEKEEAVASMEARLQAAIEATRPDAGAGVNVTQPQADLAGAREEVAQLKQHLADMQKVRDEYEVRIEQAQALLREKVTIISDMQAQAAAAAQREARLRLTQETLARDLQELQETMNALQGSHRKDLYAQEERIQELEQTLAQAREATTRVEGTAGQGAETAQALQLSLDEAARERDRLSATLKETREQHDTAVASLEEALKERQTLIERLNTASKELEGMRTSFDSERQRT